MKSPAPDDRVDEMKCAQLIRSAQTLGRGIYCVRDTEYSHAEVRAANLSLRGTEAATIIQVLDVKITTTEETK